MDELKQERLCAHCEKEPAVCVGSYEMRPFELACGTCCGHGCEDGVCYRLSGLTVLEVNRLLELPSEEQ